MVTALRILAWWMARLPLPFVLAKGRCWGYLFGLLATRHRRRADEHLAIALPELPSDERRAIRRRMFVNLGMNVAEMLRWMGGGGRELETRIRVRGAEYAQEALAGGRGVMVLTAHLGNWDLMGLWAASRYPLTIISKELRHAGANRYWMARREAAGIRIVPARNSYRACLSVLKKGGMLGFILDQNMIRDEGIFVNFFGRPACTTPGLAMLAAHAGAPILPVFMTRQPDGNHEVQFLPALPAPSDRHPETLAAVTQTCSDLIESAIRAHPDQWIWMHRRWRTQPLPAQKG